MTAPDRDRPQWEDCKNCGGDHWTKDCPGVTLPAEPGAPSPLYDDIERALIGILRARGDEPTRPCTEGPDGGTCDGSDHVRHLVWSCFTATEMGRHRDAYAKATLTGMAARSTPAASTDTES